MFKYVTEIKNRIFLLILTWLVSVLACYIYKETLLFVTVEYPLSIMYSYRENPFYFIFTDLLEVFSAYLNLISFVSFYFGALYFIYHSFFFFSPSFFSWEYFYLSLFVRINVIVFFFFVSLVITILIPYCWNFFLGFQDFLTFDLYSLRFEAKLSEYLSFYLHFLSFSVAGSQLFSAFLFFITVLSLDSRAFSKWRKIFYTTFLLIATLISPPDVFSQMFISFILFFVYEFFAFSHCFKQICISLEAY